MEKIKTRPLSCVEIRTPCTSRALLRELPGSRRRPGSHPRVACRHCQKHVPCSCLELFAVAGFLLYTPLAALDQRLRLPLGEMGSAQGNVAARKLRGNAPRHDTPISSRFLLLLGAFALSLLWWAFASSLQSPQLQISPHPKGVLVSGALFQSSRRFRAHCP